MFAKKSVATITKSLADMEQELITYAIEKYEEQQAAELAAKAAHEEANKAKAISERIRNILGE